MTQEEPWWKEVDGKALLVDIKSAVEYDMRSFKNGLGELKQVLDEIYHEAKKSKQQQQNTSTSTEEHVHGNEAKMNLQKMRDECKHHSNYIVQHVKGFLLDRVVPVVCVCNNGDNNDDDEYSFSASTLTSSFDSYSFDSDAIEMDSLYENQNNRSI